MHFLFSSWRVCVFLHRICRSLIFVIVTIVSILHFPSSRCDISTKLTGRQALSKRQYVAVPVRFVLLPCPLVERYMTIYDDSFLSFFKRKDKLRGMRDELQKDMRKYNSKKGSKKTETDTLGLDVSSKRKEGRNVWLRRRKIDTKGEKMEQ